MHLRVVLLVRVAMRFCIFARETEKNYCQSIPIEKKDSIRSIYLWILLFDSIEKFYIKLVYYYSNMFQMKPLIKRLKIN